MESRLLSYLYYFNMEQDYFECHEYGESLWLDTGRPVILKGLIQAAVCLYHLHNGNVKGGYKMWQRAKQYVADDRPVYECIDLDQLVTDIDHVFSLVPTEWYDKVVTETKIRALNLPVVKVDITDPAVEALLPKHTPDPLEDR